ncbi:MAG: HAMP domain-containing sensor histidine kinase [Gammaproteobacteria bacterium]|nr:HAMP domain-containing sensor histidine kinase [Gammaproteobacteria bacterium]
MPTNNQFLINNEHRLLGLMLFSLLAAINLDNSGTIAKSFLMVHFGLFLLWQPVVKTQSSFSAKQLIILLFLISAFIYWFNPWLNAFWTLLLLTLLTGRIFARGLSRAVYGLAVIVLFLELIIITTPELFQLSGLSSLFKSAFSTTLVLLPLLLLFVRVKDTTTKQVDFLRGFMIVLLVIFLCISSALISLTAQQPYLESLATSVIILSLFLLITAFLWTPRAGYSGLSKLWENYILNIGGPFEQWFSHVSTLESNTTLRPVTFLSATSSYLLQQHWVCGVYWKTNSDSKLEGIDSPYTVSIDDEKINLRLYTFSPVGPSLSLHAKLLLSVLIFYYRAKLQEQQLIKQAHMRAIYETGSKLTHDVKNILQATQTMTQILNDNDAQMQEIIDVLKKQMPLLTQRLNTTLEKLRIPATAESIEQITHSSLLLWWNQLQLRYSDRHIEFSADIDNDIDIPVDVFITVVENLLDNARSKRIREPKLKILLELKKSNNNLQLTVTDTGSAIDPDVYPRLLNEIVSSHDGFGIGLYQSYQLARAHGFDLGIEKNHDGYVCFSLKST